MGFYFVIISGGIILDVRFQIFAVMKVQVVVFWVVTPNSNGIVYQTFRGPYSLHLQGKEGA